MKRIIVNADDLGADEARNAGIFEAFRAGSVTSASILSNGPALGDVLHRMRSLGLGKVSFGVHINLSEGRPVSSGLKLLIGPDGLFRGKAITHELLMATHDTRLKQEIIREMAAQVTVLLDAGVRIHPLDGHQHVHVFPAAIAAAIEAAKEYGFPWVRIPEEPPPQDSIDLLPAGLKEEARHFSETAGGARHRLKGTGLRTTDHFRGLYLKGRLSSSLMGDFLRGLPEGLTELMVHPGRVPRFQSSTPFAAFSTSDRERELETLLDGDFHSALSRAGVILTSFSEARN
jgi:chitin disaccharide deacetylase